ncbi:hypothetical protein GCM10011609_37410 [Lentzea pudingi]|uniref:Uncharacterized protein n=1 Tax=Lentzea pudingi TaxID=1789439 RepID=A0ABQ2HZJ9_9PSEU|nr:hypothetical protein [Lentzea pudingi]GGM96244.1 hypothetical protein GCM10011609_37410 [Lentzea pudingi]
MRRGPADQGGVLSTFFITSGESVAAGDYDPRAAVVVWHEVFNEVWTPLPDDNVVELPEALVAQLVKADPARMHDVALSWAPLVDMDFHEAFAHLVELSTLARTAVSRAETVYLKVSERA